MCNHGWCPVALRAHAIGRASDIKATPVDLTQEVYDTFYYRRTPSIAHFRVCKDSLYPESCITNQNTVYDCTLLHVVLSALSCVDWSVYRQSSWTVKSQSPRVYNVLCDCPDVVNYEWRSVYSVLNRISASRKTQK